MHKTQPQPYMDYTDRVLTRTSGMCERVIYYHGWKSAKIFLLVKLQISVLLLYILYLLTLEEICANLPVILQVSKSIRESFPFKGPLLDK